jgi:membrane-bound serine protease (ClpP class)
MSFHRRNVYRLGLFFFAALYLVLRSLKRRTSSGREGMIGMEAEVMEDWHPWGSSSAGESWRARSADGAPLAKGRTGRVAAVPGDDPGYRRRRRRFFRPGEVRKILQC